jgi:phosphatidylinositol alpha 1,6-mannosyltransferase
MSFRRLRIMTRSISSITSVAGDGAQTRPLRVALFSGNYNYVRDGANKALNRLVGFLGSQGVDARVYSPTSKKPAFEPEGALISLPSLPFPMGRDDYRFSLGLFGKALRDLEAFAPDVIHVSAPDIAGHRVISWARRMGIPIVVSMHTRFETYLDYYKLGFLKPAMMAVLRRFYMRADVVLVPSQAMAEQMKASGISNKFAVWARGVERDRFNPEQRDLSWRRGLGLKDEEVVIGYLGRLVLEKGLDIFAATVGMLARRGLPFRVLAVGDGPAKGELERELPDAVFTGFLSGADLGRAVASMDVFFNPSVTESFGNVTLEAMACGLPVVAADATGSDQLVNHGQTGWLVEPGNIAAFADTLEGYCRDSELRHRHGAVGLEASKAFDWDTINREVLTVYRSLVGER